jgi:formamidopyrimidine-DNA glycosylase
VHPRRSVARIALPRWRKIAAAVVEVLEDAIRQGGTTLNDFADSDGNEGYFQISLSVYDREGAECKRCGGRVRRVEQAGRSTFYCPGCQT